MAAERIARKRKQDDEHDYYNPVVNGRRLLSIRRPLHPKKPTEQRVVGEFLFALKNFDFQKITGQDVDDLVAQLFADGSEDGDRILIPLGCCGIIDYEIRLQRFGPGSLNNEHVNESEARPVPYSPIVNLRFTETIGVKGIGASFRRGIVLGRIVGPHQHKEHLVQSRWIVIVDQTRLLWVVYANDIDDKDVAESKTGDPIPYSVAWDTAFGAQKPIGQKVILLGSLQEIPFKVGKELPVPEIYTIDWSTTFVPIDRPAPITPKILVSPMTVKRLLDIDTSFFTIPQYRNKNMAWLKNFLRFDGFCKDLDEANKAEGLIIGRTLTEAAWCRAVVQAYKSMDAVLEQREGAVLQANLECLSDCLAQRRGLSVFKYWLDKSIKYSGLDLINTSDEDPKADHLSGLAAWALATLEANKAHGKALSDLRTAASVNPEDNAAYQAYATAVVADPGAHTSNLDAPEEKALARVRAERQGLIRKVKESGVANSAEMQM
ncbi:hypothetical protein VTL71DRAFT_14579 [Oculimacula yallundae]|uniref:Uncharacterized protein n=1 Tax=Oculimacula yallundae TaxID=86028 RepID=A0ABR4CIV2_9HELO